MIVFDKWRSLSYNYVMKEYQSKSWLEEHYVEKRLSMLALAGLAGCSYGTIQYWLKKHGVPSRSISEGRKIIAARKAAGRLYSDEEWLRAHYWDDGFDMNEMGKMARCSGTTILRWMDHFGIPRRSKSVAGKRSWEENVSRRKRFVEGLRAAWQNGVFDSDAYREVISRKAKERWAEGHHDGEKHPRWEGGKSFEPYPLTFNAAFKRRIRERDNHTCAVCCLAGKCVHHVNYIKKDTDPTNCITLCRRCHAVTNSDREYWQAALSSLLKARSR